jgi:acetate kinase
MRILSINSGSSSLKYALHDIGADGGEVEVERGNLRRIGLDDSVFEWRVASGQPARRASLPRKTPRMSTGAARRMPRRKSLRLLPLPDHETAMAELVRHLRRRGLEQTIGGLGHRVVHGGSRYPAPKLVTPRLLDGLRELERLAPDHLPDEIAALEYFGGRFPGTGQVACFDTAFHRHMPPAARALPLPRDLERDGVVRYGFHGLSCEYVMGRLGSEPAGAARRVIIAHLGNGASMTAVKDGRGIDTSMGFTPTGGLMMSTRSGDLDPGVIFFLLREKGLDRDELAALINDGSGLLGASGISGDMQDLLELEEKEPSAAAAVALFCHLARRQLGGLTFVLEGLDTLVFTGGIGQKSPAVRARICAGLEFIGLRLNARMNRQNAGLVSAADSAIEVRVIETDEELMIARHTAQLLRQTRKESHD